MAAYSEAAMLSKAHMYSPANLAQRNLRPGHMIMVRRARASYTTSTLLVVDQVDETTPDPLNSIMVNVVPTSTMPQALRLYLTQIEDADNVMMSFPVMQGLHALIESNGSPTPLCQHVTMTDQVFVRPTGGSVRRYLLQNQCPSLLCQNGICNDRVQAYQRYPSLSAGLRPDIMQWLLYHSSGYRMLCPACYGLRLVRRDERMAVASYMIESGRGQPLPEVLGRIARHNDLVRYVLQLELGHNMYNDPIGPIHHPVPDANTLAASSGSARLSAPAFASTDLALRGGAPMRPGRRSAQDQLAIIASSASRQHWRASQSTAAPSAAQTPAQLAGIAARRREEHRSAQYSALASSSNQVTTSVNRRGLAGLRQPTVERPIRAPNEPRTGESRANTSAIRNHASSSRGPAIQDSAGPSRHNTPSQDSSAWQSLQDSQPDWEEIPHEAQEEMSEGSRTSVGTSRRVMLARQTMRYKTFAKKHLNLAKDDCSICLDPFAEQGDDGMMFMTKGCKHAFHDACAEEWFRGSEKCPLCNGRLR